MSQTKTLISLDATIFGTGKDVDSSKFKAISVKDRRCSLFPICIFFDGQFQENGRHQLHLMTPCSSTPVARRNLVLFNQLLSFFFIQQGGSIPLVPNTLGWIRLDPGLKRKKRLVLEPRLFIGFFVPFDARGFGHFLHLFS